MIVRGRAKETAYYQFFGHYSLGHAPKPTPGVVRTPQHPPCYSTWDTERKKMWDQIPFNANEYYMRYLPPGIEPRESEWSEREIEEFRSLIQVRSDLVVNSRSTLQMINGVCSLSICLAERVTKLFLLNSFMCSVNVSLIDYLSKTSRLLNK